MLKNFAIDICKANCDWKLDEQFDDMLATTRAMVDEDEDKNSIVLLGVSGGVDSTTLAVFLKHAIGARCVPVFIDNGLLRRDEAVQVQESFKQLGLDNARFVDASEEFLAKLDGVLDADERRVRIGHEFVRQFELVANELGNVRFLAQGTLYPDVIESGSGGAAIKRHHNVGGLPDRMKLKLLEPFRNLFKDEVRKIASERFNMPRSVVQRHPFPGPGLAVRCVGAPVSRERLETLRVADAIYLEELHKADVYYKISQAFAALLCLETVGVMGDAHSSEQMIMPRAVCTNDFMSADVFEFEHATLQHIATRIVNETHGVNRVLFDVTSKPPATIEPL
eukprot:TRINITY_DN375_c0_g1_i1.p2 TRINITY_DN375_c0_g1~~TRINITY_DN375_c0_g1_i1.p2  ORF type:complete len:369 (+),score=129.62 TRINITY_DN375_c0_g1_i1:99-1109(+)